MVAPVPSIAAPSSKAPAIRSLWTNMARQVPRARATAWVETKPAPPACAPANHTAARTVLASSGRGTAASALAEDSKAAMPAEEATNPR